jgi:deazaflavin-dependent oxidoreductase (nitroreductase family)
MTFHTEPGARGRRRMRVGPVGRWVMHRTTNQARRRGGRQIGMNVLVLHTVGRKSGQRRARTVSWFADGDDAWLIVAVAGRSGRNPDWYYNLGVNPDQASIDLPHRGTIRVHAERLEGDRRAEAWQRITSEQPRYIRYQAKTDRQLPIIRLSAV